MRKHQNTNEAVDLVLIGLTTLDQCLKMSFQAMSGFDRTFEAESNKYSKGSFLS